MNNFEIHLDLGMKYSENTHRYENPSFNLVLGLKKRATDTDFIHLFVKLNKFYYISARE